MVHLRQSDQQIFPCKNPNCWIVSFTKVKFTLCCIVHAIIALWAVFKAQHLGIFFTASNFSDQCCIMQIYQGPHVSGFLLLDATNLSLRLQWYTPASESAIFVGYKPFKAFIARIYVWLPLQYAQARSLVWVLWCAMWLGLLSGRHSQDQNEASLQWQRWSLKAFQLLYHSCKHAIAHDCTLWASAGNRCTIVDHGPCSKAIPLDLAEYTAPECFRKIFQN